MVSFRKSLLTLSSRKETQDYVLLSRGGSFLFLLPNSSSRYSGWFIRYFDFFIKVIDEIIPNRIRDYKKIVQTENFVEIQHSEFKERYILLNNALIYETNKACWLDVLFDIRHIYDVEEWNRIYNYEIHRNYSLLKFWKGFGFDLKVTGYSDIKIKNEWVEKVLDYDKKRNSPPFSRWVYKPFSFYAKKLVFYFGRKLFKYKRFREGVDKKIVRNYPEIIYAYKLAKEALKGFVSDNKVSVGFPWFWQEWTRDVLISLKGFYLVGLKKLVKDKLLEYSNYFMDCGKLLKIVGDFHVYAGSTGLFAKRLQDFWTLFNDGEKEYLREKLVWAIDACLECFYERGLFYCFPYETWMDSIKREGYNIEIQALFLNTFEFLYEITRNEYYMNLFNETLEATRKFVKDCILCDNLGDCVLRPNIFLAYYFYPNLFAKEKWRIFFDRALESLWLEWGGLSTIDREDPRFVEEHTGETPISYHNGDSWYWVNHIAALSMYELNKEKYKYYINKIIKTSAYELIKNKTLSELSSAKKRESNGCPSQLWSVATFIELFNKIFINDMN